MEKKTAMIQGGLGEHSLRCFVKLLYSNNHRLIVVINIGGASAPLRWVIWFADTRQEFRANAGFRYGIACSMITLSEMYLCV